MPIRKTVKLFFPPIFQKMIDKLRGRNRYGFRGNFKSFKEALALCGGYDSPSILEKVKETSLKAKSGEIAFERDSVAFSKPEYPWPLLASLLWIGSQNGNNLSVIDFGGSLGSTYYQCRKFLKHFSPLSWTVIEQPHFVSCGKKYFEDASLKFRENIKECLKNDRPQVILISSTLQYLEKPYELLSEVIASGFPYVVFDRTAFLADGSPDRVTIQTVPPKIYDATYPAWFFNEKKFLNAFKEKYNLEAEWNALGGTIKLPDTEAFDKGFIFKHK